MSQDADEKILQRTGPGQFEPAPSFTPSAPISDFRTKEGTVQHFSYKPPTKETLPKYEAVTREFIRLVNEIYDLIPDGPGKTLAFRNLSVTRMSVNSAIANEGQ